MAEIRTVLITGAAGLIGGALRRGLASAYTLRGLDAKGGGDWRRADMRKLQSIESAFEGVDAVVDLAAQAREDTPWQEVWENNLPATMNALEAARRAGVRRYVFASSNHVTGMVEREPPYAHIVAGDYEGLDPGSIQLLTTADPPRPDGPYALGKLLGEGAARYYADEHGLSAICLRIGTVLASNRPSRPRHYATLLSHADLIQLVDRSLQAPDELRFGLYYGVSNNTWRFWDIADAGSEIGYEPSDDAESFRSQ
jgi:uronate dehydrogenase